MSLFRVSYGFFEFQPTSTIYQYTSAEGFEAIVSGKKLWFSDVIAANDPREIKLGQQHFLDAVRSIKDNEVDGITNQQLHAFAARLMKYQRESTCFTCCFTLAGDSLPMWGSYGSNYTGLAVGLWTPLRWCGQKSVRGRHERALWWLCQLCFRSCAN